jgi:hypothetical protein
MSQDHPKLALSHFVLLPFNSIASTLLRHDAIYYPSSIREWPKSERINCQKMSNTGAPQFLKYNRFNLPAFDFIFTLSPLYKVHPYIQSWAKWAIFNQMP